MRRRALAALLITVVLIGSAQILAKTTSPTEETEAPRGAADDSGVFHPI